MLKPECPLFISTSLCRFYNTGPCSKLFRAEIREWLSRPRSDLAQASEFNFLQPAAAAQNILIPLFWLSTSGMFNFAALCWINLVNLSFVSNAGSTIQFYACRQKLLGQLCLLSLPTTARSCCQMGTGQLLLILTTFLDKSLLWLLFSFNMGASDLSHSTNSPLAFHPRIFEVFFYPGTWPYSYLTCLGPLTRWWSSFRWCWTKSIVRLLTDN